MYENAGDDQDEYGGAGGDEDRIECPTCGRKFVQESLEKHKKICKKVFVQKRKVFDVKKVR
jgi:zinc-finger of a C2HC-type